jgi:hypothetical protein
MADDLPFVALALKSWKTQVDRAEKLFGALSSEEVLREIAPGRNRVLYLWGHLTAAHDAMLPLLALRERLHPEFDVAFISNPDRSRADIPSHEQVREAWNAVNAELWRGLKRCRGTTGSSGTLPYRKRISRRMPRGIASRSC